MNLPSRPGPLFIGVDGGGTGCRARIEDADGNVLGSGIAGPAAIRLGLDRALGEVEKACHAAIEEAGLERSALKGAHAAVGLAGVGRKGALEQLMQRPHPFRSVVYVNDATIACIGAHGERDGGIVIVGTGSVGFAVVGGVRGEGRRLRLSDLRRGQRRRSRAARDAHGVARARRARRRVTRSRAR